MTKYEIAVAIWTLLTSCFITVYYQRWLEEHMKSKRRWKVLLSTVGLMACVSISITCIYFLHLGNKYEFLTALTWINLGAVAGIYFIGLRKSL